MLGAVDPAVGFGASTRIILLGSCDIAGCQSITLWQNRRSGLELDDIARGGFSYHCGSASDTLAQCRGLAISLGARLREINLIANSPFRHLQEPWLDAAPLPRLCPDPPPPSADPAGRRSRRALGQPECRVLRPRRVLVYFGYPQAHEDDAE